MKYYILTWITVKIPSCLMAQVLVEPITVPKPISRIMTKYHPKLIAEDTATEIFSYLRDNLAWGEGVRSKYGFTRQAAPMQLGENEILDAIILDTFVKLEVTAARLLGIYVNYYRDGNDWCPNHTHKDTKQIVISLGATRHLQVGTKEYPMGNGDVIIFGASLHGVAKEPECKQGRISIALLMDK